MSERIRPSVEVKLEQDSIPEIVESVESLPVPIEEPSVAPVTKKRKWIKRCLYISAAFVAGAMVGVEWVATYTGLQQLLPGLQHALTVATAALVGALTLLALGVKNQGAKLKKAKQIRDTQFASTDQFSKEIESYFDGSPQSPHVRDALAALPDYFTELEARAQLQQTLMNKLDDRATMIIAKHAQTNALIVAVSPFVWLDMTMSLWRCSKMIADLGDLYGVKVTGLLRWRLYKDVLKSMVFAGATEAVIHQLPWAASALSRVGQGMGVAVYTSRIGVNTVKLCRPLAIEQDSKLSISNIVKQIGPSLKKRLEEED